MIKLIGLVDFDVLAGGRYRFPNYDLGITYNYLSHDPNLQVRLVNFLNAKNLDKYDEIYIFKRLPYGGHPSALIDNYYKYNIKEFGPGFINRPDRPFIEETWNVRPDFTCYNPILRFSFDNPKSPYAWKIDTGVSNVRRYHIKLFDTLNGELLRREFPPKKKMLVLYDNPLIFFNEEKGTAALEELWEQGYSLRFAQEVDVSKITNTNMLERLITNRKFASARKSIIASEINDTFNFYVKRVVERQTASNVFVMLPRDFSQDYYLTIMTKMIGLYWESHKRVLIRPLWGINNFTGVALHMYHYLYRAPLLSFYEYLLFGELTKNGGFNLKDFSTNKNSYEKLIAKYGTTENIEYFEHWLKRHPECARYALQGGQRKYGKQRREAYYKRGSKYAFDTRLNGLSEERSSE